MTTTTLLYSYQGRLYPEYLKHGNAMQFVEPFARHFCVGRGFDVGGGKWPLPWAEKVVDLGTNGVDAYHLPEGDDLDWIFSSHCLEHLDDPVRALEAWRARLRVGGVLMLYLPHPDMIYWRPENCRKHRHLFRPQDVVRRLATLGFSNVITSERDLAWSFAVVGWKTGEVR